MSIVAFGMISLAILGFGNKRPAVFPVMILSSFYIYYVCLAVAGIELTHGGTSFIYASFCYVLLMCLFVRMHAIPKFDTLDRLYFSYLGIWLFSYLINFDQTLFESNSTYQQAPFFAAFAFTVPVLLKPLYTKTCLKKTLDYVEILGFASAVLIFTFLLLGVESKEVWSTTSLGVDFGLLRYAPIRGFFSNRQATLLGLAAIVFTSKMHNRILSRNQILARVPFLVLALCGIIISGSRGIFIICVGYCAWLMTRNVSLKKRMLVVVLVALSILLWKIYGSVPEVSRLSERVFDVSGYMAKNSGVQIRIGRYTTALEHFVGRPLIGNGMSRMTSDYDYSHNAVLSVLEDTGVVGFFWLCAFVLFWRTPFRWQGASDDDSKAVAIARSVILLFLLLSNLYGTVLSQAPLFVLLSMVYSISADGQPRGTRLKQS